VKLVMAGGAGRCGLGGVYKMVEPNGKLKIKLSSNPEKMTNPGIKKVWRFYDDQGYMEADALAQASEDVSHPGILIIDPNNPLRRKKLNSSRRVELLTDIVMGGKIVYEFPPLALVRTRRNEQMA